MTEKVTEFYRCLMCHKSVEMNEWIAKGNVLCKCGGKRFSPTRLTIGEATLYLATHPSVVVDTVIAKFRGKYGAN